MKVLIIHNRIEYHIKKDSSSPYYFRNNGIVVNYMNSFSSLLKEVYKDSLQNLIPSNVSMVSTSKSSNYPVPKIKK